MSRIHETAVIGPEVTLGADNVIGPYAVILGRTTIGDGNWIGPHVAIGGPGEVRGAHHDAVWDEDGGHGPIVIGDRNVIREFVTVNAGHFGTTTVGSDGYFMTKSHIPHDATIGDRVTVSCGALIGGHCSVGDGTNIGLGAVIHQRLAIGTGTMVGMSSVVTKHLPPFSLAYGNPARVRGANRVGLQRSGRDEATIEQLQLAHEQGDLDALRRLFGEEMSLFDTQIADATH